MVCAQISRGLKNLKWYKWPLDHQRQVREIEIRLPVSTIISSEALLYITDSYLKLCPIKSDTPFSFASLVLWCGWFPERVTWTWLKSIIDIGSFCFLRRAAQLALFSNVVFDWLRSALRLLGNTNCCEGSQISSHMLTIPNLSPMFCKLVIAAVNSSTLKKTSNSTF